MEGAPTFDDPTAPRLACIGPVQVELRGLFSGNVNVGRLYFRVYPERRDGMNVFRQIQRMLGRPETDLYVVGIFNFTDNLDADEPSALASMIEQWWDRPILRLEASYLWLLGAKDDLVLDATIAESVSLV